MLRVTDATPKYIEAIGRETELVRESGAAQRAIMEELRTASEVEDKRGVVAVAAKMASMWTKKAYRSSSPRMAEQRDKTSLGRLLANPYARTPAMAEGVADHIWTCEEIAALLD